MACTVYKKTQLIGGIAAALDSIDGDLLLDEDLAFVDFSGVLYVYRLDDDLGGAESSPTIIAPDTNPGNKRWVLQNPSVAILTAIGDIPYASAAAVLGRIADVAVGQVLISGGVGVAPAWSATPVVTSINLTGGQIAFPATQAPSADVNTLDDYEEGLWTPVVTFGGAAVDVTYNTDLTKGSYTKIGRLVTCLGTLVLTNKGSSVGVAAIAGLPFPCNSAAGFSAGISIGYLLNITFANAIFGYTSPDTSIIYLVETTEAGVISSLTDVDFANNSYMTFSLTYFI